jgi:prepilin signal peptidase PulO-like enzyme (type II secretory pathway)
MIVRRTNGQVPIPFGPFLSGASFLYILVGDRLIQWYSAMLQV